MGPGAVGVAQVAPFKRPWEMYERMKEDLGMDSAAPRKPQPIPGIAELYARRQKRLAEYRRSRNAKRKLELRKAMRDLDLDIEMRKHQVAVPDFALRRQALLLDVIDALVALTVTNVTRDWHSIFRCDTPTMREDFVKILKDLPAAEAAPLLWEKLEEQVRFTGAPGGRKVSELDARQKKAWAAVYALRVQRQRAPASKRGLIEARIGELIRQINLWAYRRVMLRAASRGKNGKFKQLAMQLLLAMGAPAAKPLVRGLYSSNRQVRAIAGQVLLGLGARAIPELIAALKGKGSESLEVAALLRNISGERKEKTPAQWEAWWAQSPLNKQRSQAPLAAAKRNGPQAAPAQRAAKSPEAARTGAPKAAQGPSSGERRRRAFIQKVEAELRALDEAKAALRKVRRRKAETLLLRRALEKQLAEHRKAKSKGREHQKIETDLQTALNNALKRELSATYAEQRALGELNKLREKIAGREIEIGPRR